MTHETMPRQACTPTMVGALATRALELELDTWPKPGLVSAVDNGSHADMDAALLRRSAAALAPYFVALAAAGAHSRIDVHGEIDALQAIGRRAEAAMLAVTGGVNTHRGALFGLGLLCAGAGRRDGGTGTLGAIIRDTWGGALTSMPVDGNSHGGRATAAHSVKGARGEAAGGYPSVYAIGLPGLAEGRHLCSDEPEAARVQAFFALLAVTDDTNLLHRGGREGLAFAQDGARQFLARGGVGARGWRDAATHLHTAFVARRLSPGGCADLLAMTLFIDALDEP